jgi:hypothetical protein
MKVKMILPALTEATSPFFRPIKYSLFPPLGLATLAAYLRPDDEIEIQDEHVEQLNLTDTPDLVVIQVYITSAYRAYRIADHYRRKGVAVALGGLHVTSLPKEALPHADSIFLGPGEDTWPQFLADFRKGQTRRIYQSRIRTLEALPPIRRDLIKRRLYLVPNSIVVSRGCPHVCDFCYKEAFFEGGRSFYTQAVDAALAEIERLPGRHLYFLDDHLFGDKRFAAALFDGMRGMGRLWQAAGTVNAVLSSSLLEKAVAAGLRSLFVGFETLNPTNLIEQHKYQNLRRDYAQATARLHDLGVMINGSFVFGMDGDDESVFERTVDFSHPDAVPGDGAAQPHGRAGSNHDRELGPVRYAPRGVPPRADVSRRPRTWLSTRVSPFLPMAIDRARCRGARQRPRRSAPRGLRDRLEEVRADVGSRDPRQAGRHDAPGAGDDPQRIRSAKSNRRERLARFGCEFDDENAIRLAAAATSCAAGSP